ncbi:hypothetical protein Tco_1417310 [Tanacetum coccineum]
MAAIGLVFEKCGIANLDVGFSGVESVEIDILKQTLSEHLKEKESLLQTVTLLKNDFKKEESRNIDREIALEKQIKQLDNIVFKRDQSVQTVHMLMKPQFFYDSTTKQALEETLVLAEESRSKMLSKHKDSMMLEKEKQVDTTPIDYNSGNSLEPTLFIRPTNVEVPKELPKVSMVNTSLKKLKYHLANFDVVVKERTTPTTTTEGSWGFEHTKACFRDEIIPFVKALKDLFSTFNQHLVDELSEVQNVFYQIEQVVEQHRIESKTFEVKMNQVLNENERLLEQVMSKDIVNLLVNPFVANDSANVHEFDTQLKLEIFQRENSVSNQSVPIFDQLFELNELKAQSQEKDMVIKKLKERIKPLSGKMDKDKIKQDFKEIETINIELDHSVTKLIAENEHLKQTYKQLYDSSNPTRILSKEQCDDLINQVNINSVEISDLNASLQEKALAIISLKDELRKLKGKAIVDNNVSNYPSDPELHQVNVEPITPKLLNKMTAHPAYVKHSQEEAAGLRDLVDHIKSNYPLDPLLESACLGIQVFRLWMWCSLDVVEIKYEEQNLCSCKDLGFKYMEVMALNQDGVQRSFKLGLSCYNWASRRNINAAVDVLEDKTYDIMECSGWIASSDTVRFTCNISTVRTRKMFLLLVQDLLRKIQREKFGIPTGKGRQIVLLGFGLGCSIAYERDRSLLNIFISKFLVQSNSTSPKGLMDPTLFILERQGITSAVDTRAVEKIQKKDKKGKRLHHFAVENELQMYFKSQLDYLEKLDYEIWSFIF